MVCNVLKEFASCRRPGKWCRNVGFGRKAKEINKANNYSTSTTTTRAFSKKKTTTTGELHGFICPHALWFAPIDYLFMKRVHKYIYIENYSFWFGN